MSKGRIIGLVFWGLIGAVLGAYIIKVVITGEPSNQFGNIQKMQTVLGAVMAGVALAWSWFFQASIQKPSQNDIDEVNRKLDEILERMNK